MARGKHGASADARRRIQTAEADIGTYQRKVAEQAAEIRDLKQRIRDQASAHSRELKVLRAQRDEGMGPMIAVLEKECQRAKDDADRARRDEAEWRKRYDYMGRHLFGGLRSIGLTRVEAHQFALDVLSAGAGADGSPVVVGDAMTPTHVRKRRRQLSDDEVRAEQERSIQISRAHGERL